ncbi:MAG: HAD-IIIC family phosphatase [Myxococcales bacterium]
MKLAEATRILNQNAALPGPALEVFLACGFTPLHLKTFLVAQLAEISPARRISVTTGTYGDLAGSLERAAREGVRSVAAALEWEDLDPRLGLRSAAPWRLAQLPDILATATSRLGRLREALAQLAERAPVALSLPTLPLPPVFKVPLAQADGFALRLQEHAFAFAASLADLPRVRVVSPQQLDALSPLAARADVAAELRWGFPYSLEHASNLAGQLARLLAPPPACKGLITDLDNTLWRGILGDDGLEGIGWDLPHGSHGHALYQRMLASLSDLGVLLGVASKNNPALAEQALARPDLLVPRDRLFPVEANWKPKSESVARILKAWNVGAESVVFVDDSPLELAEVQQAFPTMKTLLFPAQSEAGIRALLDELRDRFGRSSVETEDGLRVASLRAAQERAVEAPGTSAETVLATAEATVTFAHDRPDPRAFELVNKTNQFNLNGLRLDEATWRTRTANPARFLLTVSYADKFGPLGRIAVVGGTRAPAPRIDCWVMSCRAFSRRIEFHTLAALFERLDADVLELDFIPTERNGPLREFLAAVLGADPIGPVRLTREALKTRCPPLYAKVTTE